MLVNAVKPVVESCVLKPPCMMVVSAVLPAVRVSIARRLVKERGVGPAEVAARMGLTPAAITQYLAGVRGNQWVKRLESIGVVVQELDALVDDLSHDTVDQAAVISRLCSICQIVRRQGLICDSHRDSLHGLGLDDCQICLAPTSLNK